MPDSTLLTVTIPAYNAMPYLPQAVESILGQTFKAFRLLIINDGSTDDTKEYLSSLTDSRVRVVHQENQGAGATARRALELCDTPFCARMDADDISLADRLAVQMDYLQTSPAVGMIGTQIAYLVDERITPALPFPTEHESIRQAFFARRFPLCNPTLLFRTDLAREAWQCRIPGYGEDIDFALRVSEATQVANTRQVLFYQRVHGRSATFRASRSCSTGVNYALHCANLRQKGLPEPSLLEYTQSGGIIGAHRRLIEWREALATVHYRKYIICRARRLPLRSAFHFGMAALCHPAATVSRIRRMVSCGCATRAADVSRAWRPFQNNGS